MLKLYFFEYFLVRIYEEKLVVFGINSVPARFSSQECDSCPGGIRNPGIR